MRAYYRVFVILAFSAISVLPAASQPIPDEKALITPEKRMSAAKRTREIVKKIIGEAYPELRPEDVSVKTFYSRSNYFKAQFSFSRYFTFRRMRSIIYVNPLVYERNVPEDGLRAIIAHELAHASFYLGRNRLKLFGLLRLASADYTRDFERGADLVAISRGFGEELIVYREWLYRNVPPDKVVRKERNYFTPNEIELLIPAVENRPAVLRQFYKRIPRNLTEVEARVKTVKK